jgi:hypothetical protein
MNGRMARSYSGHLAGAAGGSGVVQSCAAQNCQSSANVWIKIRLRGKQPDVKRVVGGTIVFREIDDVIAFYRNGKKIECTRYSEGFSDPDVR